MRFTLKKTAHLVLAAALVVPAANGAMTISAQAGADLPEAHICNDIPKSDPRWRANGYCELAVAKMYLYGGPNSILPPVQNCKPKDMYSKTKKIEGFRRSGSKGKGRGKGKGMKEFENAIQQVFSSFSNDRSSRRGSSRRR